MTHRERSCPPHADVLTAFQEALARSAAMTAMGHVDTSLRPRFIAYHRRFARLPRKARRALQRQWRRSLAGLAL
jgi:hypothetical protein